jgi:hypothetical protein
MSTLLTIDQFVEKYDNDTINNGGIQCVAVANQYEADVVGGSWINANIASDWFKYYALDAVEKKLYNTIPASDPAQKGDLAVWRTYPTSGKPHIALVLADHGADIACFTQNPGAAHKETLTKKGLLGYLRPKKFIPTVKLATADEIKKAYLDILGRPADSGGLTHYQHYTLAFVKNDLANSAEKKKKDAAAKPKPAPMANPVYITAPTGFTMWGYEEAHKIAHGTLQHLNPNVTPEKIQVGQRIRVK